MKKKLGILVLCFIFILNSPSMLFSINAQDLDEPGAANQSSSEIKNETTAPDKENLDSDQNKVEIPNDYEDSDLVKPPSEGGAPIKEFIPSTPSTLNQVEVAGIGSKISEVFPDESLAAAVAKALSTTVDTELTQTMADEVKKLNVVNKPVANLTGIGNLKNLETLEGWGCQLTSLPAEIGNLKKLKVLSTPYNQLTTLPAEIGELENLEALDLGFNKITSLPSEIGALNNLTVLLLHRNQLTSVPAEIGGLINLKTLALRDNQLTSLPAEIGGLINLQALELYNNQLTSLPAEIGGLINLQALKLANNQLTSLPAEIGDLKNLKKIDLEDNQLTSLPTEIGNLENLGELILWYNQLTSLPDTIGMLTNLYYLDIDDNRLVNLPLSILELENLEEFYLSGNMLPSDCVDQLGNKGMNTDPIYSGSQKKLTLKEELPAFIIHHERDLQAIDLYGLLQFIESQEPPEYNMEIENTSEFSSVNSFATTQGYSLDFVEFIDEEGNPVSIEDYFKNGVVNKPGKVFAQVKASCDGILEGENPNAITEATVEINLEPAYFGLSFNLNGATGALPAKQSLLEGEAGTIVDNPTRTGYTFLGWNTDPNGNGANWVPGTTAMENKEITLYAQWEINTYVIHFDPNGGVGTLDDETYNYEEKKALSKNTYTKEGYTFKGWATTKEGQVVCLDEAIYTYNQTEDITLYAQWQANEPKPVTPSTPTTPVMPKTGGYLWIILGFALLSLGAAMFRKTFVKIKK